MSNIRLTEAELHNLIEESVMEVMNEGGFKDFAKGFGKGVRDTALAAGVAGATLYGSCKGCENNDTYVERQNQEVRQNMEDPDRDALIQQSNKLKTAQYPMGESKLSEAVVAKALRQSLRKVLG